MPTKMHANGAMKTQTNTNTYTDVGMSTPSVSSIFLQRKYQPVRVRLTSATRDSRGIKDSIWQNWLATIPLNSVHLTKATISVEARIQPHSSTTRYTDIPINSVVTEKMSRKSKRTSWKYRAGADGTRGRRPPRHHLWGTVGISGASTRFRRQSKYEIAPYTPIIPKQMLPHAILMPRIFARALAVEKSVWTHTDCTVSTTNETTNSTCR
mmetsp:Transcript_12980/g.37307  ORF Transcript_12980/g.37307 Transcript_12980/m.37307 type:complete len:210 (-) Transcript_12980:194-823(-)